MKFGHEKGLGSAGLGVGSWFEGRGVGVGMLVPAGGCGEVGGRLVGANVRGGNCVRFCACLPATLRLGASEVDLAWPGQRFWRAG